MFLMQFIGNTIFLLLSFSSNNSALLNPLLSGVQRARINGEMVRHACHNEVVILGSGLGKNFAVFLEFSQPTSV